MIVIGITGPTGAGKTTTLNELGKLGGDIIDCDVVYHELLERDIPLQNLIKDEFGEVESENGRIDRKKLGAIVFHDPEALNRLNSIVNRAVTQAVEERLEGYRAKGSCAVAIDAIALFESGLARLCDTTVAVIAPAEIRVERIMARDGISEDYARARVQAQNPDEFYTSRCEHVLFNDGSSQAEFECRSRALLEQILVNYN